MNNPFVAAFYLLVALVAGLSVGKFVKIRENQQRIVAYTQSVIVCLLMFCMGLRIGGNEMLFANIGTIGVQALVIAVLSTSCAVACVYLFIRLRNKGRDAR